MQLVCDFEQCEFNEDGFCEKEKVHLKDLFCIDNRFEKEEEKENDKCN